MPATVATLTPALREEWTSDQLENQLYKGDPLLERLEKTDRYSIGEYAVTPILTNRPGGYSAAPASGSTGLNAAGNTGLAQAQWPYRYLYQQVKLELAAIAQTRNKAASVAEAADLEIEQATQNLRKHITRQLFSFYGDGRIVATTGTASSATVALNVGEGAEVLARRWLHKGEIVDVGTAASEASAGADLTITAVDPTPTAPTITLSSSVTVAGGGSQTYISIANARSGATSYEINSLGNVVSRTTVLGGVDPATEPEWAAPPGGVDTTTTDLTLDSLYAVHRAVNQQTGNSVTDAITSYKQAEKFYKLLQMQVRFAQDRVAAGSTDAIEFAGMKVQRHVDCPDRQFWFLNYPDLFVVADNKPFWTDDITGGGRLEWGQGTTAFVGMLAYPINLAARRRNSNGGFTSLTAA